MASSPVSPYLTLIQLHPIKALDSVHVKEARIGPGGGLEFDRAWALYSADGQWVNGKRTAAIHLIRAGYAPDFSAVTLSIPGDRRGISTSTFGFPGDTAGAAEWFSAYFEQQINVRYSLEGFPDDSTANGPTIVSAASLDTVSTWFPGLTGGDVRLRFRTLLKSTVSRHSGKISSSVRKNAAPCASASVKYFSRAAIPARAAWFLRAIHTRAETSPGFRSALANSAGPICHPGRPRSASTIFTASPQTHASLPANRVKSCASAMLFF